MTSQLLELFERCCALEHYLRTARIERIRPLEGGSGHPDKMTLVLQGGVGVAAKAGGNPEQLKRARREVAAWVLASELSLEHLLPATVLRMVPKTADSEDLVLGSVQVLWPRFKTALEVGMMPADCTEEVSWPIAVFDALAANSDRNLGNWGVIDERPHVALIDHGHAFEAMGSNEFTWRHQDQPLPADLLERVGNFLAERSETRLGQFLGPEELDAIFVRAGDMTASGIFSV